MEKETTSFAILIIIKCMSQKLILHINHIVYVCWTYQESFVANQRIIKKKKKECDIIIK